MKNEYKIFYTYKEKDLYVYMGGKTLQSVLNRFLKYCKHQKTTVNITKVVLIDNCK
jgi:hypothetical protein